VLAGETVRRVGGGGGGFAEYFRMMNLLSQGLPLEQRGSENGGG
jgi:hypothetical protein